MIRIHEIGPEIYRISFYYPEIDLEFAQFLIKDDEPVLYHTLMRGTFPMMHEAVSKLIDPKKIRWISFSHFEADECGALNQWLAAAPSAQPVCSPIAALVNLGDFSDKPARGLASGEVLETGARSWRYIATPHLPHGWDAGAFFEEKSGTLFCSDLFHQSGDLPPITESDVLERVRKTLNEYQGNALLANYMPYTANTGKMLESLAQLKPTLLATMHGSIYRGDGAKALRDLNVVMKEVLEPAPEMKAVAR
jgi:flavorubredoxin